MVRLQHHVGNRAAQRLLAPRSEGLIDLDNDTANRINREGCGAHVLDGAATGMRGTDNRTLSQVSRVIQRWSLSVHQELTNRGVEEMFSGHRGRGISKRALRRLSYRSATMDLRLPEIWFNLIGHITGWRKKDRHRKLVGWYKDNRTNAFNHGEGGLYETGKTDAAESNRKYHIQFEEKAREAYGSINWNVIPRRLRGRALNIVFRWLGDALHIAQDRGAHGEGGRRWGHDNVNLDCDDPDENRMGYREAEQNTFEVLARASDYLIPLLERKD